MTVTECHLISISRDNYNKCFKVLTDKLENDKVAFLMGLPFFRTWSRSRVSNQLATPMGKPQQVSKDAVLVKEGDQNEIVYIVWKGEFQVR